MKTRSHIRFVKTIACSSAALFAFVLPLQAEAQTTANTPAPSSVAAKSKPTANSKYREVYDRLYKGAKTEPATAVKEALAFLHADVAANTTKKLHGMVGQIYLKIAQTQAGKLNDSAAALATLDEAEKVFANSRSSFDYTGSRADILKRAGRMDEAQALLAKAWPLQLETNPPQAVKLIAQLANFLSQQNKNAQALTLVQGVATEHPALLSQYLFANALVTQLLANGKNDEALGWAKLYFRLAPYQTKSLQDATALLSKVWTAKYLTAAKATELVAAMQDSAKPNPLLDIKLPSFDSVALQKQIALTSDSKERIALLLLGGDDKAAMIEAQNMILNKPASSDGVLQACRVFKAHDLNVKSANAFLDYYKTGTGQNPVAAFLKAEG